jgi:alpha-D-ribose 1-methylphosphonate 5-triphosphate synthase subunit PhnI
MEREEHPVVRIVDADRQSLARRVDAALADLPDGSRVDHFTYWYTGRPAVHEATVSPPDAEGS